MTSADILFRFHSVSKAYGAPDALAVKDFTFSQGDRIVLRGLDPTAAEMFMHVLTGAALPEQGDVTVYGRNTRDIATDTEWLQSLDRFGLVSNRAVLLDQSTVAQNLALPITLAIDDMTAEVRSQVTALGREVGLRTERLDAPVGQLSPDERMRVHLARALAIGPDVLLLEHPTLTTRAAVPGASAAFGETLKSVSEPRRLSWLAISDDPDFVRASGGTEIELDPVIGSVRRAGGFFSRWLR
jgi:ABC-type ATPase involved in cell division